MRRKLINREINQGKREEIERKKRGKMTTKGHQLVFHAGTKGDLHRESKKQKEKNIYYEH